MSGGFYLKQTLEATAQFAEAAGELDQSAKVIARGVHCMKQQLDQADEEIKRREEKILRLERAIRKALDELGVPQPGYPAPVANAHAILTAAEIGS